VIDASQVTLGRPAELRLSTRLIVTRVATAGGGTRLVGLLAERVTETVRREPAEFIESATPPGAGSGIGPLAIDARGLVHRIDLDGLLSEVLARAAS
jgi:chemotaxis-related protein WspB